MTRLSDLNTSSGSSVPDSRLRSISGIFWVGVVVAILVGLANVMFYGNFAATIGLVFVTLFFGLSIFRPSISLYALVFLSLITEQLKFEYSWTLLFEYYANMSNIVPSLKGLAITPMEIHLLCIVAGLLLRFALMKEKSRPFIAGRGMLFYGLSIVFFILYGVFRGGSLLPAIWEVRGIMYLFLLIAMVPQIIRTEKQINHMVWALIAGLAFRAIEVTTHWINAGFTLTGSLEGWGSHEDAGLLVTLLVFTVALYALKVKEKKQKVAVTLLVIPILMSIVASDRRSAYPVLAAALIMFVVMMPRDVQRRVLNLSWKFGIVFAIYLGVFWESKSSSALLMPVRNIREGFAGDNETEAGDSYTSNLYRKVENYDMYQMIREQPLLGSGYGVPLNYRLAIPILWDLGFYIPHNQILGVMAKTGIVGFIFFMMFYLSVMTELANSFGTLGENVYLKALIVLAGAAVVNHLVFAFFDIMLTYYRNNIYLGAVLGIASTIITLGREHVKEQLVVQPPTATIPNTPVQWLLKAPKKSLTDFTT